MAKAKAKAAPAADETATASNDAGPDMGLLSKIVAATLETPNGYMFVSAADAVALLQAGYIVQNETITEAGKFATRATAEGQKMVNPATETATDATAAKAAPMKFAIVSNVPIPERVGGRTGTRTEAYPFGQLEVGQSFFIPATEAKPQPQTAYASTVASARNRYAKKTGGTKVTRKGNTVPEVEIVRDFAIKRIEDGAAFGFPGVAGAGIWRTK